MPVKKETKAEEVEEAQEGREEPAAPPEVKPGSQDRRRELLLKLHYGDISEEEMDELVAPALAKLQRAAEKPKEAPSEPEEDLSGRVFFRSEGAENLTQVLPTGEVKFAGSIFSTDDPDVIRDLRARIDAGNALYYEDDPAVAYGCPFCKFTSPRRAMVNAHIRTRHPENAHVQL